MFAVRLKTACVKLMQALRIQCEDWKTATVVACARLKVIVSVCARNLHRALHDLHWKVARCATS